MIMKPTVVNDVLLAFPADVTHLIPENIPEKFERNNPWSDVFSEFFYNSNKRNVALIPKPEIDPQLAWRHLSCIMGSYQPKHELKVAACCYLFDAWFTDALLEFKYERGQYLSLVTNKQVEIN